MEFAGIILPSPFQFIRQFAAAPYQGMVFQTTADRMAYLTNPTRYAGQICADVQLNGALFALNAAKDTWVPNNSASLIEIADSYATISTSNNVRFVYVEADEKNNGNHTLYLYTGTELKFLIIVG